MEVNIPDAKTWLETLALALGLARPDRGVSAAGRRAFLDAVARPRPLRGLHVGGLMPLLGGVSAYWATKKGLLNYAAWIAPPLCQALGHMAVWFYPPSPGPVLVCVFVSIVGAAAGEVRLREQHKKQ